MKAFTFSYLLRTSFFFFYIPVTMHHNRFLFNNQLDALIIQILFCYKILHVSGIFSSHHQEFSTVHSALASFMQVFDDRFQAESGWNCSSILTLLGNVQFHPDSAWKRSSKTCMKLTSAECTVENS